jgi:hypothetical protein
MRHVFLGAVLLLSIGGCATARHGAVRVDERAFERLKSLAGTWVMKDEEGRERVAMVTKVTSNGSVVHETMFPGSPDHEMVNTYHMDNGTLVMTHYCAVGNQPRMHCVEQDDGRYVFVLRDITNRAKPGDPYMGALTVTIIGEDRLVQDWTHYEGGREGGKAHFEATRKK